MILNLDFVFSLKYSVDAEVLQQCYLAASAVKVHPNKLIHFDIVSITVTNMDTGIQSGSRTVQMTYEEEMKGMQISLPHGNVLIPTECDPALAPTPQGFDYVCY